MEEMEIIENEEVPTQVCNHQSNTKHLCEYALKVVAYMNSKSALHTEIEK
jgi:hypothetical protein